MVGIPSFRKPKENRSAPTGGHRLSTTTMCKNRTDPRSDDRPSITAFHHSAHQNLPLLFREFLDTRAKDVNVYNELGECGLSKACAAGHDDMVLAMLRHGADANLPGMFTGTTPLMIAAYHGRCDVIRILAHNDADAAAKDVSVYHVTNRAVVKDI